MATSIVSCKVFSAKGGDAAFDKEYELKHGENHLKSLSSSLKCLQKEVNEALTTIVEVEKAAQLPGSKGSAQNNEEEEEEDDDDDDDEGEEESHGKQIKT